jgi:hypothetical protein
MAISKLYGNTIQVDKDNDLVDIVDHDGSAKGLELGGVLVTATAAEINAAADASSYLVDATASTLTLSAATHGNKLVKLNRAAGIAVTLPAASGSGVRFKLYVGTTVTSNTSTVKVANASDTMVGFVHQFADGGTTANFYEIGSTTDTITMDGTTRGGIIGDVIDICDVATNLWLVEVRQSATGVEATPLSATV